MKNKKHRKIIYVLIPVMVLCIAAAGVLLFHTLGAGADMDADTYLATLHSLGYTDDDIFDMYVREDGLERWVGLSGGRNYYACIFEFDDADAAEQKLADSKEFFEGADYSHTVIKDNVLFIASASEANADEIKAVVKAAGY